MNAVTSDKTQCGYIAIIGSPNVGKSTLLNALIEKKLSITSRKPQTTRHRILGVKTLDEVQFVFVDTPGIHESKGKLLNQYLNKNALSVLSDVDSIIWVVDAEKPLEKEAFLFKKLNQLKIPIVIAINKIDKLEKYEQVLPLLKTLSENVPQAECVPVSAKKKENINALLKVVQTYLPESPFFFDKKTITDRSEKFIAAERVREQIMRVLGQELPYATMVTVETFEKKKTIWHIHVVIWVEKAGQKKIMIGEGGSTLKKIGQDARLAMEKYFGKKIFLALHVKVKTGWSERKDILERSLL